MSQLTAKLVIVGLPSVPLPVMTLIMARWMFLSEMFPVYIILMMLALTLVLQAICVVLALRCFRAIPNRPVATRPASEPAAVKVDDDRREHDTVWRHVADSLLIYAMRAEKVDPDFEELLRSTYQTTLHYKGLKHFDVKTDERLVARFNILSTLLLQFPFTDEQIAVGGEVEWTEQQKADIRATKRMDAQAACNEFLDDLTGVINSSSSETVDGNDGHTTASIVIPPALAELATK